jgi:hypothetical protein
VAPACACPLPATSRATIPAHRERPARAHAQAKRYNKNLRPQGKDKEAFISLKEIGQSYGAGLALYFKLLRW